MIKIERNVIYYLEELIHILYKKHYFSSTLSAENYLDKILNFIYTDIDSFPSKRTPRELNYLGEFYVFYNSNRITTWFIFSYRKNSNYVISGVINNHIKESKWLNNN